VIDLGLAGMQTHAEGREDYREQESDLADSGLDGDDEVDRADVRDYAALSGAVHLVSVRLQAVDDTVAENEEDAAAVSRIGGDDRSSVLEAEGTATADGALRLDRFPVRRDFDFKVGASGGGKGKENDEKQ